MTTEKSLSIPPVRHVQKRKPPMKVGVCLVCGDPARFVNYGALCCAPCKTFFRRRGFHTKNIPICSDNGECNLIRDGRKWCAACRFEKCLAVGMRPDLIRKEDLWTKPRPSNKSSDNVSSKNTTPLPQPRPLNLLSTDQSSLTSTHWRLLSNVINAFDTYNSVSDASKIVTLVSKSSSNIQPNVEYSLNMMTSIYTSLQLFINSTPDFRIMTSAEQCSLIQRNMQGIYAFNCLFIHSQSGVFDNNDTENALVPLYGYENVKSTKRLSSRLDYDLTLVKLMLITLLFCSNCFTINEEANMTNDSLLYGTFRLFGSQNVYAELLWKYMIYRYGLQAAVRRFDGLIKIMLDVLKLSSEIYDSNNVHKDFADEIAEESTRTLKLNGAEDVPLWGKMSD